MRKLLSMFCLGFFFFGCSQKEKTGMEHKITNTFDINQYISSESKTITKKNYAEKVFENIKHYKSEPIYYFRTNKQNCLIEIYVNDVQMHKDYEISNLITPFEINQILKSGTQKVTIKMYPVGNLNNESWGKDNQAPITELSENSSVEISVVRIDEKSNKGFDDETLITKQLSPKDIAGKEMYEFSFTFDAQVPYEFEGWTKGQDLQKLDQELVKKKSLEYYQMIGKLHLDKDLESWLKINYPLEKRIMGSSYSNLSTLKKVEEVFEDDITGYDYEIEPIKNYKMEYMGNGKLLRLRQNSLDKNYRGKGALCLKFEDGIYFPGITLYLPEGRDLATQGFMMWK